MKITKFGHCCLLVEASKIKVLFDPGRWSEPPQEALGLDAIIITHEHGDHLHSESLRGVLEKNPDTVVICNQSVANILSKEGIEKVQIVGDGGTFTIKNILISGYGTEHATIINDFGLVENTGYFFENFFFPGDAFTVIAENVNILALPIAGPWCKISEVIEYLQAQKPTHAFPVHDAILNDEGKALMFRIVDTHKPEETILHQIGDRGEIDLG